MHFSCSPSTTSFVYIYSLANSPRSFVVSVGCALRTLPVHRPPTTAAGFPDLVVVGTGIPFAITTSFNVSTATNGDRLFGVDPSTGIVRWRAAPSAKKGDTVTALVAVEGGESGCPAFLTGMGDSQKQVLTLWEVPSADGAARPHPVWMLDMACKEITCLVAASSVASSSHGGARVPLDNPVVLVGCMDKTGKLKFDNRVLSYLAGDITKYYATPHIRQYSTQSGKNWSFRNVVWEKTVEEIWFPKSRL